MEVIDLTDARAKQLAPVLAAEGSGGHGDRQAILVTHPVVAGEAVGTKETGEAEVELGGIEQRRIALVLVARQDVVEARLEGLDRGAPEPVGLALEDQPAVEIQTRDQVGLLRGDPGVLVGQLVARVVDAGAGNQGAVAAAQGHLDRGEGHHAAAVDLRAVVEVVVKGAQADIHRRGRPDRRQVQLQVGHLGVGPGGRRDRGVHGLEVLDPGEPPVAVARIAQVAPLRQVAHAGQVQSVPEIRQVGVVADRAVIHRRGPAGSELAGLLDPNGTAGALLGLGVVRDHLPVDLEALEARELPELGPQHDPAGAHEARVEGGVVIGRDVPVEGEDDLGSIGVRGPDAGDQETGSAPVVDGKAEIRAVEHRDPAQPNPRVTGGPHPVGVVEQQVTGSQRPVGAAGRTGRVDDIPVTAPFRGEQRRLLGGPSQIGVSREAEPDALELPLLGLQGIVPCIGGEAGPGVLDIDVALRLHLAGAPIVGGALGPQDLVPLGELHRALQHHPLVRAVVLRPIGDRIHGRVPGGGGLGEPAQAGPAEPRAAEVPGQTLVEQPVAIRPGRRRSAARLRPGRGATGRPVPKIARARLDQGLHHRDADGVRRRGLQRGRRA